MNEETIRARVFFPDEARTIAEVLEIISAYTFSGVEFASEINRLLEKISAEHNVSVPECFWVEMAIIELFNNIAHHDHLDIHGPSRDRLLSAQGLTAEEQDEFEQKIAGALGCSSEITLLCSAEGMRLEITLVRPFSKFPDAWRRAKNDETSADISDPTGRGLLLAAQVFSDADHVWGEDCAGHLWFSRPFTAAESTV